MTSADGTEIAGYQVIRKLGSGGMGEVFLVQNPTLPRREAFKLLDGALSRDHDFRARFSREAELLSGLSHQNIVTLYNRGQSDESLWLTMEYIDGVDCAELLRTQGPMPVDVAVPIIAGAAAALDYAYQRRGITHRDVKPANILVTFHDGKVDEVKLADFGIAKAAGESTNLTSTGLTIGTMAYISPEAISDSTNLTGAADQYSLAATAYALLTGTGPFTSVGAPALMYDHLHTPVPAISTRLRDLSRELDTVFERALAKKSEDRHPTCSEFASAFATAAAASATALGPVHPSALEAPPSPAHTPDPRGETIRRAALDLSSKPRRRRWPLAAAAVILASIVGISAFIYWPEPETPKPTVLATIAVGKKPGSPVFIANRSSAYVSNLDDGTVSVIDTDTLKVVDTVRVGRKPYTPTVTDSGETAYVTNGGDGTVSVIDTKTNRVTNTLRVGADPWTPYLVRKSAEAYVVNRSDGTVTVIDTVANVVVATIRVGTDPGSPTVTSNGAIVYIPNRGDGTMSVINTGTRAVNSIELGRSAGIPHLSPSGDAVYATCGEGRVCVFDTNTRNISTIRVDTSGWGPQFSPTGDAAYVAGGDGTISVIDTSAKRVVSTIPLGAKLGIPEVSPNGGTVYVTTGDDGTVSVIDTSVKKVIAAIRVGGDPQTPVFAPNGANAVYITSRDGNLSVVEEGEFSVVAVLRVGSDPSLPVFTRSGSKAYVANTVDGTVSVIDTGLK